MPVAAGANPPVTDAPCEAGDTARLPHGGRICHGRAGAPIAREADDRDTLAAAAAAAGMSERLAALAGRGIAVDGERAADVAHARGPIRRRVGKSEVRGADAWCRSRRRPPARPGRSRGRAFDGDRASPPAGAHPRGQEGAARRPYKAS